MEMLSEHLSIAEFTESATATAKGIENTMPNELAQYVVSWAENVFEPVRALLGVPLKVTSGYRCPDLNKAVGGVPTSQHVVGQAGDLIPEGVGILDAFQKILVSDLIYDQLIYEHAGNAYWLHISYLEGKNRNEVLIYDGSSYQHKTKQEALAWVQQQQEN